MIRRPPRSTLDRSSAASDVYKRQIYFRCKNDDGESELWKSDGTEAGTILLKQMWVTATEYPVSYTHLRAHETVLDLVCRLLLEKKKNKKKKKRNR